MSGMTGAQWGVRAGKARREALLAKRRDRFLAQFASNCNVQYAAKAARISVSTLYLWRRSDPAFAADWAHAVATGYLMLEARLLAHALSGAMAGTLDGNAGTPIEPLNVELALKLMQLHRPGGQAAQVRRGRPTTTVVTREAMLAELMNRLDVIERRRRLEAARAVEAGADGTDTDVAGAGGAEGGRAQILIEHDAAARGR